MCDFGSEEARYDFIAGWNQLWIAFTSPRNGQYLKETFTKLGYKELKISHLRPYMSEVFATTQRSGYDPAQCSEYASLQSLNEELIEYMIPIFENQKMSMRSYIMDQKYFKPIDRPIDVSCKRRPLLYNNRFP